MTFDDARVAVAGGTTIEEGAGVFVGGVTPDEGRWCVDGDCTTWAALRFLSEDG